MGSGSLTRAAKRSLCRRIARTGYPFRAFGCLHGSFGDGQIEAFQDGDSLAKAVRYDDVLASNCWRMHGEERELLRAANAFVSATVTNVDNPFYFRTIHINSCHPLQSNDCLVIYCLFQKKKQKCLDIVAIIASYN